MRAILFQTVLCLWRVQLFSCFLKTALLCKWIMNAEDQTPISLFARQTWPVSLLTTCLDWVPSLSLYLDLRVVLRVQRALGAMKTTSSVRWSRQCVQVKVVCKCVIACLWECMKSATVVAHKTEACNISWQKRKDSFVWLQPVIGVALNSLWWLLPTTQPDGQPYFQVVLLYARNHFPS